MACPDASAAIHECVLAIKAHVPVDVLAETIHAFPSTSRIFNGLFADARRELDAAARTTEATRAGLTGDRLGLEDDPPVDEDHRRAGGREGAAGLDRLVERRGRDDHDVGALADRQPAAIELVRGTRRRRRRRPAARASSVSASPGANGGVPAGQRGSSRRTASAIPGHGSNGSTGASVPNARTAPVAAIDAQA